MHPISQHAVYLQATHRTALSLDACVINALRPLFKQALLLRPASALPVPEDLIQDWLEGKVGKALLRRFDDPAEACREQAVSTLTALLQVG